MSLDTRQSDAQPVTSVDALVDYFRGAEKPAAAYRLGLEHEKLLVDTRTWGPVPYEGPSGIGALIERFYPEGFQPFRERDGAPPIALTRDALTLSLEPGGQFELSGSPVATARAARDENAEHLESLRRAAGALGLLPVSLGYRPFGTTSQMPWMPKSRYGAMRASMGPRGRYALDMMLMTATCQISLDWSDEADCARKVSVGARAAPLLVALYANSPIVNGAASGKLSFRSQVWTDVDPARCGTPSFFLDGSFSYRAYAEWALDVPMLFLRRGGAYLQPNRTFRAFLSEGFEGQPALASDWVDHLSTLFPEVRIKRVLEIRSADGADGPMAAALAALYRGLFYDATALSEAEALLPKLDARAHETWMATAREKGLSGQVDGQPLLPLAADLVRIAKEGLRRLDVEDVPLLEPLESVLADGVSPGERVLAAWEKHRNPEALFRATSV